jgi:PmbA protein
VLTWAENEAMTMPNLSDTAERALARMRRQGFEQAQVGVALTTHSEVTAAHNQASLLRSTETLKLSLLGLVDGRKASTELGDVTDAGLAESIAALWDSAKAAPQDEANAVSSGQQARIVQGPQTAELATLADTLGDLLAWRAANTPTMMLEEGLAGHTLRRSHTLTSGGSDLACELGWYELVVMGSATEGAASSSFNFAGGSSHDLGGLPAAERFGLGEMMRALTRQVHTQALSERFVGDVVLTPSATTELLGWLLEQVSDGALITDTSVYRERAGDLVASPLLDLQSRFSAPGVVPLSGDAFNTPPLQLLRAGRLACLTPSLYGSRRTGVPHVPTAGGWELAAGSTPLASMIAAVPRGALVDRLSMGEPAANGDFSGVIKNSFLIEGGEVGPALSEVMISGNVAQMLKDVVAVSRERVDTGSTLLPWLRVTGLNFT